MINVKPQIVEALKKCADNVSPQYPAKWVDFPIIQYTEEDNREHTIISRNIEAKSYLRYRIDIWTKKESTSSIVASVNSEIRALGLQRTQCADVPDPSGLKHTVMRFECVIDNRTERVYNA